jgi:mRNA interferase RelE/StbE
MYQLELSRQASRQILKLPSDVQERIHQAIALLGENPRHPGSKKLTDLEGYRVRVGDYRILYAINDNFKTVIIYRIKGRGEVYRK